MTIFLFLLKMKMRQNFIVHGRLKQMLRNTQQAEFFCP